MSRPAHKNALPNYVMMVIDERKLIAYALDISHTIGKDLAEKFKSVLGFDKSNWMELAKQITENVPHFEAILVREDMHGKRFRVDLPVLGANGNTAIVRTVWIILADSESPILDTLRVLPQGC
jgi:uncharacterized protein